MGHFAQGFAPAIAARKLLLSRTGLARGAWLFAVVVLTCSGLGRGAEEYLGTQGDPRDTQQDMAPAGTTSASISTLRSTRQRS
ncbi:MAG: hypothetical protein H7276_08945, partial [Caulobacter sp.]|nr:hypothetical protein [Vitreoscilla sp.]